ncbi:MAG: lysophospholipid acyltransferase family protein [Armatimonadetes bacterium]|nr:lysophospholipid acyltransferase family protein [Armatimonadota bacterium]
MVGLEAWARRKTVEQAERTGARLGMVFFWLSAKHRTCAMKNLELVFPEMSFPDRKALAKRVFQHFGRVALDFVRTEARTLEEVIARTTVHAPDHLAAGLSKGKGVLNVGMHFGNWERMVHFLSAVGHPMSAVVREADEAGLEAQIRKLREHAGMDVLARGNAVRAMLTALRAGKQVSLLADQNAYDAMVPFFGKPAGTALGPAVLHLRTGAPIVLCFYPRIGPGRYEMIWDAPIDYSEAEEKPTPEEIMEQIHRRFEEIIRKYPEQWLWFHDRWRSARRQGLL